MKVLVCGGRHFMDRKFLYETLNRIHKETTIHELIHGGANGADIIAGAWANLRKIPVKVYRADWNEYGRSAGPIRNEQMLKEAEPDLVVAFPGGTGTNDMVCRSLRDGVKVIDVRK